MCYGVANAKTVTLDPPVASVWPSATRCMQVKITKTTKFTLTAEDANGKKTAIRIHHHRTMRGDRRETHKRPARISEDELNGEPNDGRSRRSRRSLARKRIREHAHAPRALKARAAGAEQPHPSPVPAFELDEITFTALADGMKSGQFTARSITEKYLERIAAIDAAGPTLRAVIETNPDALAIADALDKERAAKGPRGPLHGIPILIKDNIDTADKMSTTAGSLALVGARPPKDSYVAQKLRAAGAVILGKTNPSEWANIRSSHATSGWSGRGGLTKNPYALDRNPCGSSSGSGAAASANLAAGTIGTETDGSIVCPSSANGIVGIKPTVGLISRTGIIPISHSQDSAGPMCRTVRDAAILLGALTGVDVEDHATDESAVPGRALTDYTKFLDPAGLKGARIGIVRRFFGFSDFVDAQMEIAIDLLKREGAHHRRSRRHRSLRQRRLPRIHRAPLRTEKRSQRLPRPPRPRCAREISRRRDRLQRKTQSRRNAVLRPGHVRESPSPKAATPIRNTSTP